MEPRAGCASVAPAQGADEARAFDALGFMGCVADAVRVSNCLPDACGRDGSLTSAEEGTRGVEVSNGALLCLELSIRANEVDALLARGRGG